MRATIPLNDLCSYLLLFYIIVANYRKPRLVRACISLFVILFKSLSFIFSVFYSKDMSKFLFFSNFSQVVHPFFLCCDWLFELFLLCDCLIGIVRLQSQTVRLQAQNSAIAAKLLFLETNQNAGITSDFKMDIINNGN